VDVVVEIVGFSSGNWAEISGYIIQEDTIQGTAIQESSVFTPFSAIRQVPAPPQPDGIPTVTVNVPGLPLNPGADVKVIVRVTEAQIWPTRLKLGKADLTMEGIKATWEAKTGPTSLLTSIYGVLGDPAQHTHGQQTFTMTGPNGSRITVTVNVAAPG
jgi:hypothetical protein